MKSTDSNNQPEDLKNYSDGWDRIFGKKLCELCDYEVKPGDKLCKRCIWHRMQAV